MVGFTRAVTWSPSDGKETKAGRENWVDDKNVKQCFSCFKKFEKQMWSSSSTGKHHCRVCGNIFCSYCSSNRVYYTPPGRELEANYTEKKKRACVACFRKVTRARQHAADVAAPTWARAATDMAHATRNKEPVADGIVRQSVPAGGLQRRHTFDQQTLGHQISEIAAARRASPWSPENGEETEPILAKQRVGAAAKAGLGAASAPATPRPEQPFEARGNSSLGADSEADTASPASPPAQNTDDTDNSDESDSQEDSTLGDPEPYADEEPTAGMYLTYDRANCGTLTLVWSKTTVKGALAFGRPGVKVPTFKYAYGHTEWQLCRNVAFQSISCDKKGYFQGWTKFIQTSAQFKCTVVDYGLPEAPLPSAIWVRHAENSDVVRVLPNEPFTTEGLDAIAVVYKSDNDLSAPRMDEKITLLKCPTVGNVVSMKGARPGPRLRRAST